MTFAAPLSNFTSGWKMNGFRPEMNGGASVDPTHIVEHGATHLHGLGPFGALSYAGAEGTMSLTSLDAAIVSAGRVNGTLSAFPTPGDNSTLMLCGREHPYSRCSLLCHTHVVLATQITPSGTPLAVTRRGCVFASKSRLTPTSAPHSLQNLMSATTECKCGVDTHTHTVRRAG